MTLIEKLEAAQVGSHELDVAIYLKVYDREPDTTEEVVWDELVQVTSCPPYTTSLDAAMSLIPDHLRLADLHEDIISTSWHALIGQRGVGTKANYHEARAATAPLALSAAALKARGET